jgi:hypothetical protein
MRAHAWKKGRRVVERRHREKGGARPPRGGRPRTRDGRAAAGAAQAAMLPGGLAEGAGGGGRREGAQAAVEEGAEESGRRAGAARVGRRMGPARAPRRARGRQQGVEGSWQRGEERGARGCGWGKGEEVSGKGGARGCFSFGVGESAKCNWVLEAWFGRVGTTQGQVMNRGAVVRETSGRAMAKRMMITFEVIITMIASS